MIAPLAPLVAPLVVTAMTSKRRVPRVQHSLIEDMVELRSCCTVLRHPRQDKTATDTVNRGYAALELDVGRHLWTEMDRAQRLTTKLTTYWSDSLGRYQTSERCHAWIQATARRFWTATNTACWSSKPVIWVRFPAGPPETDPDLQGDRSSQEVYGILRVWPLYCKSYCKTSGKVNWLAKHLALPIAAWLSAMEA